MVVSAETLSKRTELSVLVDATLASRVAVAVAAPAGIDATTVPCAVMPVTAMLYVVPLPVTAALNVAGGEKTLEVRLTPDPVKPVTGSLNTAVKLIGPTL